MDDALAINLKRLRAAQGLTQAALAERAGLPRATLAGMEQPGANPSLRSLLAAAKALGADLDELLVPPPEHRYFKVVADEVQEYRSDDGRFQARLVSPIASKGVQFNLVTMLAGCATRGRPHPRGSQEFFATLAGTAHLVIAGEEVSVATGELVQFPGHLPHHYQNRDRRVSVSAVSVVVFHLG